MSNIKKDAYIIVNSNVSQFRLAFIEMLLVEDIDDRDFLNKLLNAIVYELPAPKKKK